ncbi:MAG: acetyl-CoA carboxylase biotin carboxyl carrier protein subunit [Bacteroidales bacterium]|jgi:biotin carboxyl carrier protein|nr:acetyl-CoA carboxylase biotin carboxyl carrier protein subunit [Bacteroidales bacterium]NLM93453.1 acetyl-CoA carboxylase biotin carboxyl carrier protein subunit [Bacteroidales bacterium]
MEDKTLQQDDQQFVEFIVDADIYRTTVNKKYSRRKPYEPLNPKMITAFMPGTIQDVYVKPGQEVKSDTILCILEAMKMKNKLFPPFKGIVKTINVEPGQLVPKNFVIIELE